MVRDTLEICSKILAEKNSDKAEKYNLFDSETDEITQVDTEEAYELLPKVLAAAASRQPIMGLWTKERHYKPERMDVETATKLDLGNVTFIREEV